MLPAGPLGSDAALSLRRPARPRLWLSRVRKLRMPPICSEPVRDLGVACVSHAVMHSQHGHRLAERSGRCSSRRPDRRHERAHRSTKRAVISVQCSTAQSVTEHPPTGGRAFFDWLVDLPWKRVGIWGLVVCFVYQLKDFFGIAMGTFILSFIGNSFVEGAQRTKFPFSLPRSSRWRRRLLVLTYYATIVSVISIFGLMTIPSLLREGADFVSRLQSDNIWVVVLEKTRDGLGDGLMNQLERFLLVASGDEMVSSLTSQDAQVWSMERSAYLGTVLQKMMRGYTDAAVSFTTGLLTFISRFAVQVGVSLVLSFMVVWDLPMIATGVKSLETSRLADIYREVAPSLKVFGELFGRALQAQARIAAANTALTALGMSVLQIPGLGLLSVFVFICSFIPIAGCFISTVPIGFVALTEYGFFKLALVIGMVTGIHFVEAYLLNPAIYAAHLKLHPLLVLSALVVAEHSLGVWGLLLAVPLTVFCLDYCIRYPACSLQEIAVRELETVSSSIDFDSRRDLSQFVAPPGFSGGGNPEDTHDLHSSDT